MASIVDIYAGEVHRNLKPLYANWDPGRQARLGDVGILKDDVFIHVTSLDNLGVSFNTRDDPASDHKFFISQNGSKVTSHAKGSLDANGIAFVNAALEVEFTSDKAVMFNAADCSYSMIDDKNKLGQEVMDLYKNKKWKKKWVVITDLITSGSTTLAISGGSTSSIVFQATGNVQQIDLADASLGLSVAKSQQIGYQLVASHGLTPLFGLCKIQSNFWYGNQFEPMHKALAMFDASIATTLVDSPSTRTKGDEDPVHFGQMS
ncbi:MAG: hypothetical protein KMY53_05935 [Desulfarculus sp.]|nr:hypothetical protein [Pseudomonadota bacterium]MBV1716253.1 hypothetical protein [Desulfarculus sp.]MBU4574365.1 hypothetical protein [Pseudomonadota bacterium]MBU4599401.1 hypothetical protein [Pseudomonadota bacterium]MBV1737684.1 hypothetical protein [Desulfarculus sp.]